MKQSWGRVKELKKGEQLKEGTAVSVYAGTLGASSKEKYFLYMDPKKR